MSTDTRQYGNDTWLRQRYPFGLYVAGAAMCTDGKVRRLARIAETADTFFSVPAAVRVNGRYVSGFITVDREINGEQTVCFTANKYGRNGAMLPGTHGDAS